jgi:hypothetical protein
MPYIILFAVVCIVLKLFSSSPTPEQIKDNQEQRFVSTGFVETTFVESDVKEGEFDVVWEKKC